MNSFCKKKVEVTSREVTENMQKIWGNSKGFSEIKKSDYYLKAPKLFSFSEEFLN